MDASIEKYPYFIYPMLEKLEECDDPVKVARLKELIAANIGDPQALIAAIGDKEADFRDFYPTTDTRTLTTDATIDSFLSRFGGSSSLGMDSSLFPTAILDEVTPDKNQENPMETEGDMDEEINVEVHIDPKDEQIEEGREDVKEDREDIEDDREDVEEALEDIEDDREDVEEEPEDIEEEPVDMEDPEEDKKEEESEEESREVPEEDEDDSEVGKEKSKNREEIEETAKAKPENTLETVRELVKNRDYEQALEILETIYLNNPKKSIYFADQIRFIKKMMLSDRKKQK